MNVSPYVILLFFSIKISVEDLRFHKIRNIHLLCFFTLLCLQSILIGNLFSQLLSGLIIFTIFTTFSLVGTLISKESGIGFGDVKLLTVLAFGFIDVGIRHIEIFLLSLWCALLLQVCLHYIYKRRLPSSMAMAPSIFLAVLLYLSAPIALLLPQ